MQVIRLEYQRISQFTLAGAVLLALALAGLVVTGAYYRNLSDRAVGLEAKAEQIERLAYHGRPGAKVDGRATAGLKDEVMHANQVLRQLSFPWEKLFNAVESSGSKDVSLLALDPDLEKGVVRISGEARNFSDMLDYISRLEGQDAIGTVYLQSHQVQQKDPDKPVRFALLAVWSEKP